GRGRGAAARGRAGAPLRQVCWSSTQSCHIAPKLLNAAGVPPHSPGAARLGCPRAAAWRRMRERCPRAVVELAGLGRADGRPLGRTARLAALADAPAAFPRASAQWAGGGETQWRERLLDTSALKVVAVLDGVPVGLVSGVVEGGCAWLHSLWVSPRVRGQ